MFYATTKATLRVSECTDQAKMDTFRYLAVGGLQEKVVTPLLDYTPAALSRYALLDIDHTGSLQQHSYQWQEQHP